MSHGADFRSTTVRGPGDRRLAAAVTVVLVAFIGAAIAKPWGSSSPQAPQPVSSATAHPAPPSPSSQYTGLERTPEPSAAAIDPLPVAFTTPRPSPASAPWIGLSWRRLAQDDPLTLVTSVVRSRVGYVAVGLIPRLPATPVWTSADGQQWSPIIFGATSTFWPAMAILDVVDLPTGLVAVSEAAPHCDGPCSVTYVLPVVSWTSPDGRHWSPHLLPQQWFSSPAGVAPLVTSGPGGLLVASRGRSSRLAMSADGVHWRMLPATVFPSRFALEELLGTPQGYVAVGSWPTSPSRSAAASLWSPDGRSWMHVPTLLASAPTTEAGGGSAALFSGSDGAILAVRSGGPPGQAAVWQSADGKGWRLLQNGSFSSSAAPGPISRALQPTPRFAADGARIVAIGRGAAWVSRDGRVWRALEEHGTVPDGLATQVFVLPDGVLVRDGSAAWFGEAIVR